MNLELAQSDIIDETSAIFDAGLRVMNLKDYGEPMRVAFINSMNIAGRAYVRYVNEMPVKGIKYSLNYLSSNYEDGKFTEIVRHEVAHLLTFVKHKERGFKPHGNEWRTAMRAVGGKHLQASFSDGMNNPDPLGAEYYEWNCTLCDRIYMISPKQLERISDGYIFKCTKCKCVVEFDRANII